MRYDSGSRFFMHQPRTSAFFVRPRPAGRPAAKLFCVPFCGGAASVFRGFAIRLPDWIEPLLVQLPGRATRVNEPPYRSMSALVNDLAEAVSTETSTPYALLGYSLGAVICFEVARQMRRRNLPPPVRLFALASGAPHTKDPFAPIHQLPDREFLVEIARLNGTPREVLAEPQLMQALLPMLRADFCVHETYVYADEPALDVPISVIGGTNDRRVSAERLEAWQICTSAGSSIRTMTAGHFFLHEARDTIVEVVSADLRPIVSGATGF
jgi:surfactin synthase thioesterase subunit